MMAVLIKNSDEFMIDLSFCLGSFFFFQIPHKVSEVTDKRNLPCEFLLNRSAQRGGRRGAEKACRSPVVNKHLDPGEPPDPHNSGKTALTFKGFP